MIENRDQSTQCDFPIVVREQKHLRRHYTSDNLKYPTKTQWTTIARPKSLHLSLDTTPIRARLTTMSSSCNTLLPNRSADSPLSSYPGSELTVTTESRRDKSPASSIYSIIKEKTYSPEPNFVYTRHFKEEHRSKWQMSLKAQPQSKRCTCQIHCDKNKHNTPEGLSWRRLHMSRAKLKATATTSELLSGFAMVAMVELQINEPTTVPEWLFVLFAICTTVLVAVHIFALMISTYLLPNIDAISKLEVSELVGESPHERMKGFIELAWAFSTILGLFLFLVEIAILCWVKFWDHSFIAAMAATIVVIPVLILFVGFAVHFYHSLVVHKCDTSVTDIKQLEDMKKELDMKTSPV